MSHLRTLMIILLVYTYLWIFTIYRQRIIMSQIHHRKLAKRPNFVNGTNPKNIYHEIPFIVVICSLYIIAHLRIRSITTSSTIKIHY